MYIYKAFGLIITSEIILSELVSHTSIKSDIMIKIGKVPDTFENIIIQKHNHRIGKNKFRLDHPGIAKYFVENGKLIMIEPYEGASFAEIKLYLLGSCMGAILFQRDILPLHGSCLDIGGQGVLLTGQSGAGKSTIAAAIVDKGYKMITDDVAAVTWDANGELMVYPSYPSQKLWEDAIERRDKKVQVKTLNRVCDDLNKYCVANHDSFQDTPILLKKIYEIIPSVTDELIIEELKSTEKLASIIKNTYRRFMTRGFDSKEWHFKYCAEIASQVLVYRIKRPQGLHLEQEIASKIIEGQ